LFEYRPIAHRFKIAFVVAVMSILSPINIL